jgi:FMN phosphatase YigB (HAD superfamily)
VLVEHDNALLFQRLAERCSPPQASPNAIQDAIMNSGIRIGEQSVPELHVALVRSFAFRGDYSAFAELWVSHFIPIPETLELVRQLHGDYRLFILSDTNEEHWQHVSKNYLDAHLFERVFLSHRERMGKPDPRLFEHVLETIGCPASHCLFVDDKPENVQAARALGINAYVYSPTFNLYAELAYLNGTGQ